MNCATLQIGPVRSQEGWTPRSLTDSILEHSQSTLEVLIIEYGCTVCRLGGIGSLQGFNKLTTISLSASLLPLQDREIISLVDFLPQTVEDFYILNIFSLPHDQELQLYLLLAELEAWSNPDFSDSLLNYFTLEHRTLELETLEMVERPKICTFSLDHLAGSLYLGSKALMRGLHGFSAVELKSGSLCWYSALLRDLYGSKAWKGDAVVGYLTRLRRLNDESAEELESLAGQQSPDERL